MLFLLGEGLPWFSQKHMLRFQVFGSTIMLLVKAQDVLLPFLRKPNCVFSISGSTCKASRGSIDMLLTEK